MSERVLDDWIDSFMLYTQNSEPPDMFRLWTGISVVAAAMQRKCYLSWGTLTFYPNIYVVLVGPSGCRKGTALGPGYDLLMDATIKLSADATTLQALIRRLREANDQHLDPITNKMVFHSSITIFSKEFTVFLGYHNRELMAALCDWYDCGRKWTYDTKNQGTDEITGVWVNLIGATTPSLIQSSMPLDAIGGGLTSRMIFVVEEGKKRTVAVPLQTREEVNLGKTLQHDLEKINLLSGAFKVTPGFMDAWVTWYETTDKSPPPFRDERFAGYFERRPNHVMKLSMIMAASRKTCRTASGELVLTEYDLARAIRILTATEVKMPRVFSGVGKSPISDLVPRVMKEVGLAGEMEIQELMRIFHHDADKFTMDKCILTLEGMGFLKRKVTGHGPETVKYIGPKTEECVENFNTLCMTQEDPDGS